MAELMYWSGLAGHLLVFRSHSQQASQKGLARQIWPSDSLPMSALAISGEQRNTYRLDKTRNGVR